MSNAADSLTAIERPRTLAAVGWSVLAIYGPQVVAPLVVGLSSPDVRWAYLRHFATLPGFLFSVAVGAPLLQLAIEVAVAVCAVVLLAVVMSVPLAIRWYYFALAALLSAVNASLIASWLPV